MLHASMKFLSPISTLAPSILSPDLQPSKRGAQVVVLSHGCLVYQGPTQGAPSFFVSLGFRHDPSAHDAADFLLKVSSRHVEMAWCRKKACIRLTNARPLKGVGDGWVRMYIPNRFFHSILAWRDCPADLSLPFLFQQVTSTEGSRLLMSSAEMAEMGLSQTARERASAFVGTEAPREMADAFQLTEVRLSVNEIIMVLF